MALTRGGTQVIGMYGASRGQRLVVGAEGFLDAQAVHRQQRDERMVPARGELGLDEQGAELAPVEPERTGLVVHLGTRMCWAGLRSMSCSCSQ